MTFNGSRSQGNLGLPNRTHEVSSAPGSSSDRAAPVDVAAARADLPATWDQAYLNTGTAGPLPQAAAQAMARAAASELESGRVAIGGFQRLFERLDLIRDRLGAMVGANADELAFTHNTTEGMNIATWGLRWSAGDRVLTTNLEHAGGLLPLYQIHRRLGVEVDFADCGLGERDRVLEALRRGLRSGPRLLVLSHVNYQTGAVMPLAEITAMAHAAGTLVLVDGAQSVGAIPVDMHALGVDFYAFPGQKWLLGPEGTGSLYVRGDLQAQLESTYLGGFASVHDGFSSQSVEFEFRPGARRYEVGSVYRPGVEGLLASLEWLEQRGDVFGAVAQLSSYCRQRVGELPGAEILTPNEEVSGLVSFRIPGLDTAACLDHLSASGIAIRSIPDNGALRLSCGFYNTPAEIDRTFEAISDFSRA